MPQDDSDAQTLTEQRAQQQAQAAATEAAQTAADAGATPTEAKKAAHEAAEEALAKFRLHDDDVERIANANAQATVNLLREAGAFDPPANEPAPQAGTPAAAATIATAPAPAAAAAPVPADATGPEAVEAPRKISRAEKFAGIDV